MAKFNIQSKEDNGELEVSQIVPRDVYTVRIIDVEHQLTKKDSLPMYHFSVEIVDPEVKTIEGVDKKIAGLKFDTWCMLEKNTRNIKELHAALDLPDDFEVDEESNLPVDFDYKGMEFLAVLESKEEPMKNAEGQVMKGRDGKPIMTYQRNFIRVA